MGHFPLLPQLLPMCRDNGPVAGCLVCRISPGEEDRKRGTNTERGGSAKNEWESLPAQEKRKDDVDNERSEEDVTEHSPPTVYALGNEIVLFREPHFVRKGKQMCPSGHECDRIYNNCEPSDKASAHLYFSSSAGCPLSLHEHRSIGLSFMPASCCAV